MSKSIDKLVSTIVEALVLLRDGDDNIVEIGTALERYVQLEGAEEDVDLLITILRHSLGEYEQ
jgi:hypothetical protein